MRTIKELLQILENNFDKHFKTGLCGLIGTLKNYNLISSREAIFLRNYIFNNRPKYAKFRYKLLSLIPYDYGIGNPYYWYKPKRKKPRFNWIQNQIEIEHYKEQQ